MQRRSWAVLVAVLVVALLGAGCSGGGGRPGGGGGTGVAPASDGYAVTVRAGGRTERFDTARLSTLAPTTVQTPESDGATTQTGPTLASVLTAAGVGAYTGLRVAGPEDSVTLTPADVRPDLVLATTKRGTVKLSGPGLPPDRWVRDVTDVEVTG